jgi:hypothetical protein
MLCQPGQNELTTTSVPVQGVVLAKGLKPIDILLTSPATPCAFTTEAEAEVIWDFGRQTVGGVAFCCRAERSLTIDVRYGEDLTEALRDSDYTQNWYSLPQDQLRIEPGREEYRTPGRRAFRYVRMKINGPLEVQSLSAWFEHHPVALRGSFSSNDVLLNRAWALCEHTTRCCMQRYYEDGVKRDGLLWIGDYRVAFLCNAYLYGDVELARRSLAFIAETQQEDGRLLATALAAGAHQHPDRIDYMNVHKDFLYNWSLINYTADFVCSLWEMQLLTEAGKTTEQFWPVAKKALAYLRAIDEQQAETTGRHTYIIEEGKGEGWKKSPAALGMQLAEAQRAGEHLARTLGDLEEAEQCEQYLRARLPRLRERYLDPDLGCICDRASTDHLMIHATSQAIMAGLCGDLKEAAEWTHAAHRCAEAQRPRIGFAIFYWLAALFRAGNTTVALQEARAYWGLMLRNGATSCWGMCDLDEDDVRRPETHAISHCHGWSAGLVYLLPAYVLGARSVAPGAGQIAIRPQLGDLHWAEGTVPLPSGSIHLLWRREGGALTGRIEVDCDSHVELWADGAARQLQRGRHEVTIADPSH